MACRVIVTGRNFAGTIVPCLESIFNQDNDFTMVVIDNASTDGSHRLIEQLSTVFRYEYRLLAEQRSLAFCQDLGIHVMGPEEDDIIIVVDPKQTLPSPETLKNLCLFRDSFPGLTHGTWDEMDLRQAGKPFTHMEAFEYRSYLKLFLFRDDLYESPGQH